MAWNNLEPLAGWLAGWLAFPWLNLPPHAEINQLILV